VTDVSHVVVEEQGVVVSETDNTVTVLIEEALGLTVERTEQNVVVFDESSVVVSETEEVLLVFAGEQGPPGPPGAAAGEELPYAERTDFVGDDLIYRGYAEPGVAESASTWRIKRLDIGVDGDVTTTWAGGTADFVNAWDDRASYIYS